MNKTTNQNINTSTINNTNSTINSNKNQNRKKHNTMIIDPEMYKFRNIKQIKPYSTQNKLGFFFRNEDMRLTGLEPARSSQWDLNPSRLPIPP